MRREEWYLGSVQNMRVFRLKELHCFRSILNNYARIGGKVIFERLIALFAIIYWKLLE